MNKRSKLYNLISVAALAVATLVAPASAHPGPVVATCSGTLTVAADGLTYLGLNYFTNRHFDWFLKAGCDTDADGAIDSVLQAAGREAYGSCLESSAPFDGAGVLVSEQGHETIDLAGLGWSLGAGGILTVTGEHTHLGGGRVTAGVYLSGGTAACITEAGANDFGADIVVTLE